MIVLLFGPPGCGKGTQASFIAGCYAIPAISTGEILRAECTAGTPLGKQACNVLASGELISDDIVNQIVAKRLAQQDCQAGYLLDGYPRTIAQARFLEGYLRDRGLPEPIVIHLDVPAEEIVARITARRQCPECHRIYNLRFQPPRVDGVCDADGTALVRRADDTETVIRARLKAYEEQTGPVLSYYPRRWMVNGNRSPEQISKDIALLLGAPVRVTAATR